MLQAIASHQGDPVTLANSQPRQRIGHPTASIIQFGKRQGLRAEGQAGLVGRLRGMGPQQFKKAGLGHINSF